MRTLQPSLEENFHQHLSVASQVAQYPVSKAEVRETTFPIDGAPQSKHPDSQKIDSTEIQRAIGVLFQAGDIVEVRIPKTRSGVVAGYFDDLQVMAAAIGQADSKYRATGIYYVLNEIDPALLGRAYNRLKEHAEYTTADSNITRRRWLPVDLDPVRPAGVSASNKEHEAALVRAQEIAIELERQFGRPIVADSGNGAHLLYQINLPNDSRSLSVVTNILADLDRRFSDPSVKVDVTSGNAARIWKAYGTVARKGDSIPSRPHRISRILEVRDDLR